MLRFPARTQSPETFPVSSPSRIKKQLKFDMDSNQELLHQLLSYDNNQEVYDNLLENYKQSILDIKHSFTITKEL